MCSVLQNLMINAARRQLTLYIQVKSRQADANGGETASESKYYFWVNYDPLVYENMFVLFVFVLHQVQKRREQTS